MGSKEVIVKNSGGGISASSLLGIVFIVLKLTGHIDWSWFWVLSPFWIPLAILLIFLVVVLLFAVLGTLIAVLRGRKW